MIEIAAGSYVRAKPHDIPTLVDTLVVGSEVCTITLTDPHPVFFPLATIDTVADQPLFEVRVHSVPMQYRLLAGANHTLVTTAGDRAISSFALNSDGWLTEEVMVYVHGARMRGKLVWVRPAGTGTIYRLALNDKHVLYAGETLCHD